MAAADGRRRDGTRQLPRLRIRIQRPAAAFARRLHQPGAAAAAPAARKRAQHAAGGVLQQSRRDTGARTEERAPQLAALLKLNANYNYGSSDIYNQNYQDNSNQIWTTTTTGREQSWWNVGASFSLPIDEIFNRRNKIKQQKRRIEQVELDTERWLEEQRIKVIQQYTLAVQQLSVLRSAVEAMVTAQAQYRLSEADFINGKLDAQTLSRQKNIENVAIREYEEVRRSLNNALLTLEVLTRTPIISQPAPATDAQAPKTE